MATTFSTTESRQGPRPMPREAVEPSDRWERLFYGVGPYVCLVLLWEGARILFQVGPEKMPSLWAAVQAIQRVVATGILPDYVVHSLWRLSVAGAITISVGVVAGLAIGLNSIVAELFLPVLRYFNSLSGIVWLPLFLIWFGLNDTTAVAAIGYTLLFPVVFNTVLGVRTVPRVFQQAVLTLGGSWLDVIRDVIVPGSLPSVIAGIRLGFAYGWRALIASEMLLGLGGIGYMIFKAQSSNLTDRILAGMIIIGVLWSIMDYIVLQPLEEATIRRWGLVQR